MDYVLLILLGLAWAIGTPIVALVALVRSGNLRAQNEHLAFGLAQLRRQIEQLERARALPPVLPPAFVDPVTDVPAEAPVQAAEAVAVPEPEGMPEPEGTAEPALPPSIQSPPEPIAAATPEPVSFEQRLGARAFIWIGAVTLALAAIFLVRYSIEEGYLSPEVRVMLAALFGFGLIAGAEKLRSRDDWVAQAMTALARRWMQQVEREEMAGLFVGIAAGVLAFAYISLEVRHFFDPAFLRRGYSAAGIELYAYSFFWLLFGVALLALGFVWRAPAFRHAGMALVCIVVGKVFLIDMAGLRGLLRVFSFLGLGAVLLGLGYVYRRFGLEQRTRPDT